MEFSDSSMSQVMLSSCHLCVLLSASLSIRGLSRRLALMSVAKSTGVSAFIISFLKKKLPRLISLSDGLVWILWSVPGVAAINTEIINTKQTSQFQQESPAAPFLLLFVFTHSSLISMRIFSLIYVMSILNAASLKPSRLLEKWKYKIAHIKATISVYKIEKNTHTCINMCIYILFIYTCTKISWKDSPKTLIILILLKTWIERDFIKSCVYNNGYYYYTIIREHNNPMNCSMNFLHGIFPCNHNLDLNESIPEVRRHTLSLSSQYTDLRKMTPLDWS